MPINWRSHLRILDGDIARIRESRSTITTEAAEAPSRRKPLPDHLPREDVLLDVDSEICGCCGGALHAIGESVSEMLDWIPAQLRVVRHDLLLREGSMAHPLPTDTIEHVPERDNVPIICSAREHQFGQLWVASLTELIYDADIVYHWDEDGEDTG
jgi:hypothetical protein